MVIYIVFCSIFLLNNISLYESKIFMCPFTSSGHTGCLNFFVAVVSVTLENAAVGIYVWVFLWTHLHFSCVCDPRMKIGDQVTILPLAF